MFIKVKLSYILYLMVLLVSSSQLACIESEVSTKRTLENYSYHISQMLFSLRKSKNVKSPWPKNLAKEQNGFRENYTQCLEILSKINSYRSIQNYGEIYIRAYPLEQVKKYHLLEILEKIYLEMKLLVPSYKSKASIYGVESNLTQALAEISKAFDPLFGRRGFTKGSLFAQSLYIVDTIKFLRRSQGLDQLSKPLDKVQGKHANHVLKAAYKLRKKVIQSQSNLWMKTAKVKVLENRVISPIEAYDELQDIIYELDRIKFRLGIESNIELKTLDRVKSSQETLKNLAWALSAMPQFLLKDDLQQYDRASLYKASDDIYSLARETYLLLKSYKKHKGIRVKANKATFNSGLGENHVYQKALNCLHKINLLRKSTGLMKSADSIFPNRNINLEDVYTIVSQLNAELKIICKKSQMVLPKILDSEHSGNSLSDVYFLLWKISYELDVILGTNGYTPNDVYRLTKDIQSHIKKLSDRLSYKLKGVRPTLKPSHKPKDVMLLAKTVLKKIYRIRKRAGMFRSPEPTAETNENITPNDVFNLVTVLRTELEDLENHLGLSTLVKVGITPSDKTPGHVYQELSLVDSLLDELLGSSNE